MLTDTGPLIALLNAKDLRHTDCQQIAAKETGPLVTSWPVITEAMHLLYRYESWRGQRLLLDMLVDGDLVSLTLESTHVERIRALMEKYRDVPRDFADASLVVLAESLNISRVFTLDSDFLVYRLHSKHALEVVP